MKKIKSDPAKAELSFYTELPCASIDFESLRAHAYERLKILKKIENNIKDTYSIKSMEDDLVSHACLKLICAQAKWSSIWFVNMETQLFKFKLAKDQRETENFFIEKFWSHLKVGDNIDQDSSFDPQFENFLPFDSQIKVHFSKCSDILAKRQYEIDKGYFNINNDVIVSLLANEFKRYLSKKVDNLYNAMTYESEERLQRLNSELFVEKTFSSSSSNAKDILSKTELFPLCMRGILDRLKTAKHLKYPDRQALCLFLKDLGVPLNDTIHFFKTHFHTSPEQFEKDYLYSIRHNYGLEGKRANYSSFTCLKLIGSTNDPNAFGCPFVKNQEYVKKITDIEDMGREPIKCCSKVAEKIIGEEMKPFLTPADYFRIVDSSSKSEDKNKEV